ncbi:MAG: chorismate synthase [Desulfobulbaceae bacterium]|jgi:chorismate synthase|nr:chorismate synthase [Desulfobulbaceae bacterium]
MSSAFGTLFRISTFGESHGQAIGLIIDGCPPGLALNESDIQPLLDRRRPGQSALTTGRKEGDRVTILSGVENGRTLGTPIALVVYNADQRPGDYGEMAALFRPSHADFTYHAKYGIRAASGGGRASARETIASVAAGAVAEKILRACYGVEIVAWVAAVGDIDCPPPDMATISRELVDATDVRCPDQTSAAAMRAVIGAAKEEKDSVGGIIACVVRGVAAGWGEPVYDKLEAKLAQAMLAIPASKGFEIGSGFAGSRLRGSQHNDPFINKNGRIGTATNYSGGVQGGISNGEMVYFRVAFKPTATIGREQRTVDAAGNEAILAAKGRHDPCVAPRAVPIVEALTALTLVDLAMRQEARRAFFMAIPE